MRGLILSAIVVAIGLSPVMAAAPDAAAFDGTWDVLVLCPSTADGAFGYTLQFTAQVKSGLLHGLYGTAGKPSSLTLDGTIEPDGTAKFAAKGLTGDSVYTQAKAKPATAYSYDVTATFKGSRGSGVRVGGSRTCNYTFTRHRRSRAPELDHVERVRRGRGDLEFWLVVAVEQHGVASGESALLATDFRDRRGFPHHSHQEMTSAMHMHRSRRFNAREPMAVARAPGHRVEIVDRAVDELGRRGIIAGEGEWRRVAAE